LTKYCSFRFIQGQHERPADRTSLTILIVTFALGTLMTQSTFLFPMKLQTTLHRVATHLGQWRLQSLIRTDTVQEWSSDCNSYTRGSVVKLSSHHQQQQQQHFLAIQHLSNAAHPQSKFHSFLYRFFGDATNFLTAQFVLCLPLILLNIIWILRGTHWQHMIIGCLLMFYNSYPIYKIVRDRVIMDFVEEHESFQTLTLSKQKKLS
jgi:hypothetical protein